MSSLMVVSFWYYLLHFFLPAFCLFCQRPLSPGPRVVCEECWEQIPWLTPPVCDCCGAPFRGVVAPQAWCQECITKPPPFRRARAAVFYEDHCREAIHRFKYGRQFVYGRLLRDLLAQSGAVQDLIQEAEVLLPVPLHPRRLRQRGFNQALLLAKAFPEIPLVPGALVRQRHTRPQAELSPEERRRNVKGAFRVTNPQAVRNKKVVLLDDVYTTGATVRECARVVRAAGALQVEVITVARVGYAGG